MEFFMLPSEIFAPVRICCGNSEFSVELSGCRQEESRDGSQYIHEMVNGKADPENDDWLLKYSVTVIRLLQKIAEISTRKR